MGMPARSDKIFSGDLVTLFRSMDRDYRGVPVEIVAAFIAERYPPTGGGSGAVDSVNGQTGVVVLAKSDVGLGLADNTADADKPVSSAQASAIGAKQDTLVSGTNIKTINGNSLLGAGDLVVTGGGSSPRTVSASVTFVNEDTSQQLDVTDAAITAKSIITAFYLSEDYAIQDVKPLLLSKTPGAGYSIIVIAPDGATGQVDLTIVIQEAA